MLAGHVALAPHGHGQRGSPPLVDCHCALCRPGTRWGKIRPRRHRRRRSEALFIAGNIRAGYRLRPARSHRRTPGGIRRAQGAAAGQRTRLGIFRRLIPSRPTFPWPAAVPAMIRGRESCERRSRRRRVRSPPVIPRHNVAGYPREKTFSPFICRNNWAGHHLPRGGISSPLPIRQFSNGPATARKRRRNTAKGEYDPPS